jgi:hypothetical protein
MKPRFDPNNGNVYVTIFDSGSVSVISTTLTPTQAIQKLINTIDSFHLPKGVTTSLEALLNAALAQLNRNNPTPACNQVNAFLNQVNAKQTNGQLTPQQAADLSQQAKAIQIGCSNIGAMLGQTSPSLLPLPMLLVFGSIFLIDRVMADILYNFTIFSLSYYLS